MCRVRQQAAAERDEAARRAANNDNSRQRALDNMMQGTLERKKDTLHTLVEREPWMSIPLKDMTAAQRQQLHDFERKVADLHEAREAAKRGLEAERKGAEEVMMAAVATFNVALQQLHDERMRTDMALAVVQQQQFALAATLHQARIRVSHASCNCSDEVTVICAQCTLARVTLAARQSVRV